MLKTKSSSKLIQWQRNLRRIEQVPCDLQHHLVKESEHPKIKCSADIFDLWFLSSISVNDRGSLLGTGSAPGSGIQFCTRHRFWHPGSGTPFSKRIRFIAEIIVLKLPKSYLNGYNHLHYTLLTTIMQIQSNNDDAYKL